MLARDDLTIACEVSVAGTIDYEVGNITKCFKAGFTRVAMVSTSAEKLKKLSAAVLNSLGEEQAKGVGYFLPDAFLKALRDVPVAQASPQRETRTRGGRTVHRKVISLSPEEARTKEEQALKLMAQFMKERQQCR